MLDLVTLFVVVGALALCAYLVTRTPTDVSALRRSGMTLFVDARTGCQYLSAGRGLTPRLDETGKQICKKGGA